MKSQKSVVTTIIAFWLVLMSSAPAVFAQSRVIKPSDVGILSVTDPAYGAKCDVVATVNDGAIHAGANTFTSSVVTFTPADLGKYLVASLAGASSSTFVGKITGVSGNTATLDTNAGLGTPWIVNGATINAVGANYVAGDEVVLNGSNSLGQAVLGVTSVNGSGGITGINIITPGAYSSALSGTISQGSTNRAGSGASFTIASTQISTKWYYGSDDGAAINAALVSQAAGSTVNIPAGGCGTTIPIELTTTYTANAGGGTLVGKGQDTSTIYALATSMSAVVHRGSTFRYGGGAWSLSIEGFKLATNTCFVEGGANQTFFDVKCKNGLTAEWRYGGSVYLSAFENWFYNPKGITEPSVFPIPSLASTYNWLTADNATDSRIINPLMANAGSYNFYDQHSGANQYSGAHGYGIPIQWQPAYCYRSDGSNNWFDPQCDGGYSGGFLVNAFSTHIIGGLFQQWLGGPTATVGGIVIASNANNILVEGVWFAESIPGQTAIVQLGTANPTTVVCNNTGAFYKTCGAPLSGQVYLSLQGAGGPNITQTTNGSTASGSATIILNSVSFVTKGAYSVGNSGNGLPDGSTVTNISGNTITVSLPTTGTISSATSLNFNFPLTLCPFGGNQITINGTLSTLQGCHNFSSVGYSTALQYIYAINGQAAVSGAASNGAANLVRLTLANTTGFVTGNQMRCEGIVGTTEADSYGFFYFTGTLIDSTHIDLQGTTFTNPYVPSTGYCSWVGLVGSTTGHVTASNGIEVKSGDATQTLVGMADVASFNGQFRDTSALRYVASWYNRQPKMVSVFPAGSYTISNNATSFVAPSTRVGGSFLTWGPPSQQGPQTSPVRWRVQASIANSFLAGTVGASACFTSGGLANGGACASPESEQQFLTQNVANNYQPVSVSGLKYSIPEGYRAIDMIGFCTGTTPTCTFNQPYTSIEAEILQ